MRKNGELTLIKIGVIALTALLAGIFAGFWLGNTTRSDTVDALKSEVTDTQIFIDSYLKADGKFLTAVEYKLRGDSYYSEAGTFYRNYTWNSAIKRYNDAMEWYSNTTQELMSGKNLLNHAKSLVVTNRYQELCEHYIAVLESYLKISNLSYDVAKYMELACTLYIDGEFEEGNSELSKANNLVEVWNEELKTYNALLDKLNTLLQNWDFE